VFKRYGGGSLTAGGSLIGGGFDGSSTGGGIGALAGGDGGSFTGDAGSFNWRGFNVSLTLCSQHKPCVRHDEQGALAFQDH
jgi:hypothetical protein